LLPAAVLAGIEWSTDRTVSVAPIAIWVFLAALVTVLRNYAGMRELERAHQQALWLASHDIQTDMLRRSPFLHEVSEGSMRDRSGTVIVLEVGGIQQVADQLGLDVADHIVSVVAQRLFAVAGEGALPARMAPHQFVVFLRSNTLGRGRQVAGALQHVLTEPITCGDHLVHVEFSIGVAQADGAVIDVLAGVRRATEAMRHSRRLGSGHVSIDADLTGTVLASSVQSSAPARSIPATPMP
jgi:diguanylate cyclase (GGDEF)-like protein